MIMLQAFFCPHLVQPEGFGWKAPLSLFLMYLASSPFEALKYFLGEDFFDHSLYSLTLPHLHLLVSCLTNLGTYVSTCHNLQYFNSRMFNFLLELDPHEDRDVFVHCVPSYQQNAWKK